mmetsp:Transcript_61312/g.145991  ORF Transcript_61312/g.145991 Transcript_61312/m.145991 type:complete len:172 (-) Transcript_61312:95-610(-)|eukprot:CAMPEP_0178414460 /NCGR_PEP_ID=MMETSP0689_2-20121128/23047_1 /TAXON_ID=160604 /ORGANISM="Amphidinium massartii, Strain CS-259" /LENGTH=171 /DNA_ID=CAMNT_0020035749 /DNA_START=133 /DNA_END=648 /DNA_ORIENTATION=+
MEVFCRRALWTWYSIAIVVLASSALGAADPACPTAHEEIEDATVSLLLKTMQLGRAATEQAGVEVAVGDVQKRTAKLEPPTTVEEASKSLLQEAATSQQDSSAVAPASESSASAVAALQKDSSGKASLKISAADVMASDRADGDADQTDSTEEGLFSDILKAVKDDIKHTA